LSPTSGRPHPLAMAGPQPPSRRPSLSRAVSSPPRARIMSWRTHHALPRRLPSRNGRPTRAPSPSMAAGHCARATASTPPPLPLFWPIKAGQRSRITPHPSPLLLPRPNHTAAGAPPAAGTPPPDLLLRHSSRRSKPLGKFPRSLASF
jgi:hypothetical protein